MARKLISVVLAAGEGKRMRTQGPKVLVDLLGTPLIGHVLAALGNTGCGTHIVVGGKHLPQMKQALREAKGLLWARQMKPLGTAHAVMSARKHLPTRGVDVLIVCGDAPLIRARTLREAVHAHRKSKADVTVLTALVDNPKGLGSILRDEQGHLRRIVEEKDCSEAERTVREINAGQFVVRAEALARLLPKVGRNNAQGEYYLTDLVALAGKEAHAFAIADAEEARGVNTPKELDAAREELQARVIEELRAQGVIIPSPKQVVIEPGATIGEGTVLHPFVVIRRGASIAAHCSVGPAAVLRDGARLEEGARVGNFVEVKASRLGRRARALHLSYLGDADVGEDANVAAGCITANFDGVRKHRTHIGAGVSLGAGTILVAPVSVGRRAKTGAGAVVLSKKHVAAESTVVGVPARPLQRTKRGRRVARRMV